MNITPIPKEINKKEQINSTAIINYNYKNGRQSVYQPLPFWIHQRSEPGGGERHPADQVQKSVRAVGESGTRIET